MDYIKELIKKLDATEGDDPESAHDVADEILLAALKLLDGQDVVDAYLALQKRCGGFWYA
jgi:hypothetical protein